MLRGNTFSKKVFIKTVSDNLKNKYRKTIDDATQQELYQAVSDSTAVCRISKCGKCIHETRCQSSESTVSKCRIRLLVLNIIDIHTNLIESLLDLLVC